MADAVGAVVGTVQKSGMGLAYDIAFALVGAAVVGAVFSFTPLGQLVPGGWAGEAAFLLSLVLAGVCAVMKVDIGVKLALGAAFTTGLLVAQKWAAKFGVVIDIGAPIAALTAQARGA